MPDSINPTIAAAVITGFAGPLITIFAKDWYEKRNWKTIKGRDLAIVGSWKGIFSQFFRAQPVDVPFDLILSAGKREISGTGYYQIPGNERVNMVVTGRFVWDHQIRLDYTNSNPNISQNGSLFLKLNNGGDALEGTFAGFGLESNDPISGTLKVAKVRSY